MRDSHDACKMGKTNNVPERDTQYATGEIERGHFEAVYEVYTKALFVENLLKYEFHELNIRVDAGTEFYNEKIITLIEPYLTRHNIEYKKLSKEDIHGLTRCNRIRKLKQVINKLKFKRTNKQIVFTNQEPKTSIIHDSVKHFKQHDKGMLVLMCGVGKTLISLWITQQLVSNTILIGVPNKLLLEQWEGVISDLFKSVPIMPVSGDVDAESITRFLEDNRKKCIMITTYASSHKVYDATHDLNHTFDMKINDECHHLTSKNINTEGKTFVNMLKIKSNKQLSLTATLKILENKEDHRDEDITVSNDSIDHFGIIIDKKMFAMGD